MKTEAILFAGVAGFFLVTDVLYAVWSRDPTGTAALTISFLMALLVAFFFATNYRRKGLRPEDAETGRSMSGPARWTSSRRTASGRR